MATKTNGKNGLVDRLDTLPGGNGHDPVVRGRGRKSSAQAADEAGGGRFADKTAPGVLIIKPVEVHHLKVRVRGTTPLIIRAWDQKTAQQLADKQKGIREPKSREAENPDETYQGAKYVSEDGWEGIPASAFKAAMVEAISTLNLPIREFNMTLGKKSIFVHSQGYDRASGRELVRIHGKSERFDVMQPTSGGGPYMSYRPRYRDWEVELTISFNPLKLNAQSVLNLLTAAGKFVGVGEHRPSAKESKTGSSGLWTVLQNVEILRENASGKLIADEK